MKKSDCEIKIASERFDGSERSLIISSVRNFLLFGESLCGNFIRGKLHGMVLRSLIFTAGNSFDIETKEKIAM